MSEEHIDNEALGLDELHADVLALDAKIADANKAELSDAEKEALNALIEQRNEAFIANHAAAPEA